MKGQPGGQAGQGGGSGELSRRHARTRRSSGSSGSSKSVQKSLCRRVLGNTLYSTDAAKHSAEQQSAAQRSQQDASGQRVQDASRQQRAGGIGVEALTDADACTHTAVARQAVPLSEQGRRACEQWHGPVPAGTVTAAAPKASHTHPLQIMCIRYDSFASRLAA